MFEPHADAQDFLGWISLIAESKFFQGLGILASFIGLGLSIYITIRAYKFNKIFRYNETVRKYNRERAKYEKQFNGHINSVLSEKLQNDLILKTILVDVEGYASKYRPILGILDIWHIYLLKKELQKNAQDANFMVICNKLARFCGRSGRMEEEKRG